MHSVLVLYYIVVHKSSRSQLSYRTKFQFWSILTSEFWPHVPLWNVDVKIQLLYRCGLSVCLKYSRVGSHAKYSLFFLNEPCKIFEECQIVEDKCQSNPFAQIIQVSVIWTWVPVLVSQLRCRCSILWNMPNTTWNLSWVGSFSSVFCLRVVRHAMFYVC